ncbi:MAG: HD-GYP domain-containing protein, partial [Spirochaetota bacterium]
MSLLMDIFIALSRSIDLVDSAVGNHNKRVAYIAGRVAHNMRLNSNDITKVVIAGALHDIGVVKETEYTELAHFNYRSGIDFHSELGYRLLKSCSFTKDLAPIVRYHHVYYKEKNIPSTPDSLLSDIIFLADRVDALIDYSTCVLSQKEKVCATIQEFANDKFNPNVVTHFVTLADQESFWFDLHYTNIEKTIKDFIFFNHPLSLEEIHEIAKLFTKIIDFKSRFTATHSSSVAMIARQLGSFLNFSERECLMLDIAGHVHDLGKLAIPLTILEKKGSLTKDEFRIMKHHPYFTYQVLDHINDLTFKVINEWASFHHERLDGRGYPFKLSSSFLTKGSQIMAVADMFTALSESRPYRDAMGDNEIIHILQEAKGAQ